MAAFFCQRASPRLFTILNRSKGVISRYDHLFQRYSGTARMDWRLMAAQCYQESCFDPNAKSWAGACGLMQIMPGTAAHLGLPMSMIHEPEANVAAAARYMAELQGHFSDVGDPSQRMLLPLLLIMVAISTSEMRCRWLANMVRIRTIGA